MKYIFIFLATAVSVLLGFCFTIINSQQTKISAYEDYYLHTETLLDSLYIDGDNPIMESDAGAEYLNYKREVDSLYGRCD